MVESEKFHKYDPKSSVSRIPIYFLFSLFILHFWQFNLLPCFAVGRWEWPRPPTYGQSLPDTELDLMASSTWSESPVIIILCRAHYCSRGGGWLMRSRKSCFICTKFLCLSQLRRHPVNSNRPGRSKRWDLGLDGRWVNQFYLSGWPLI